MFRAGILQQMAVALLDTLWIYSVKYRQVIKAYDRSCVPDDRLGYQAAATLNSQAHPSSYTVDRLIVIQKLRKLQ